MHQLDLLQAFLGALLVLDQAVAKDLVGVLFPASAAQDIDDAVMGNLVEPDAERLRGAQPGQPAKQDKPDVLEDVEGRFAVCHETQDEVEQAAVVTIDKPAKSVN